MLGTVKDTEWSVLIMDGVTTRVMSSICRISEVLDYGVSRKLESYTYCRAYTCLRTL